MTVTPSRADSIPATCDSQYRQVEPGVAGSLVPEACDSPVGQVEPGVAGSLVPATCDSQYRQVEPGVAGSPASAVGPWTRVCPVTALIPGRGVAALVDGRPVAVFWLGHDEVLAVDDVDPFTGVALLSRGLVGDVGGEPTVASPLYKQRFALRSGRCLDDEAVALRTWPARVRDGQVEVGVT